jgi:DedD protein
MTDQEYREIQLSGKQIVFLFMSLVVVAVVIFLLGVSVGRGVRSPGAAEAAQGTAPTDTVATVGTPPPTQTSPGDLKYHSMLQGQPGQAGGSTATPPPAGPPPSNPPAQTDPVPTEPQTPPTPPPGPATTSGRTAGAGPAQPAAGTSGRGVTPPPPSPAPAPTPPKPGGWMVQVGAFRSRENAESLVAQLKRKGHAATIVRNAAVPNAPHIVRVGPFADRAEADRAAAVLAKEQGVGKPSVTR